MLTNSVLVSALRRCVATRRRSMANSAVKYRIMSQCFGARRHDITSSLRVKNDFNVAIDPLIEFLKGSGCLRERQAMRNDLARPGTTDNYHIAQLGVVALIG